MFLRFLLCSNLSKKSICFYKKPLSTPSCLCSSLPAPLIIGYLACPKTNRAQSNVSTALSTQNTHVEMTLPFK
jgi:hypothetical protein